MWQCFYASSTFTCPNLHAPYVHARSWRRFTKRWGAIAKDLRLASTDLRAMAELYSSQGKAKKNRQISEDQLTVIRNLIQFVNPKLMETLALASVNSVSVACAGLEMLIARPLGEGTLNPNSARWMKPSCEDSDATRQNQTRIESVLGPKEIVQTGRPENTIINTMVVHVR